MDRKFKIGDRVIITKWLHSEDKGVVTKNVENGFYKVTTNDDYYIRGESSMEIDKQYYRDIRLKRILNGE